MPEQPYAEALRELTAIAQGFAEANGGRISVESRSGQGATFVLTLPVAKVAVEA